jgi:hypothetical protein
MPIVKDKSVEFSGLCPEMHFALGVSDAVFARFGSTSIVTSLDDGAEILASDTSPQVVMLICEELQRRLGPFGFEVGRRKNLFIRYQPHPRRPKFWQYVG